MPVRVSLTIPRVTPIVDEIESARAGEVVAPESPRELLAALRRVCDRRATYMPGVRRLQERYEYRGLYDAAFSFMRQPPPGISATERRQWSEDERGSRRQVVDRYFRNNVLLSLVAAGAAAANFLLHPVLARYLSVEEYGEIQAMFALVAVVSVVPAWLAGVATGAVSGADERDVRGIHARMLQAAALRDAALLMTALVGLSLLVAAGPISHVLRFDSVAPLIGFAVISLATIPVLFRGVLLGAYKRYYEHAVTQLVQSGSRVVLATSAVLGGLRSAGVIVAAVVAQGVAYVYAYVYANRKSPVGARSIGFVGWRIESRLSRKLRSVAADAVVAATFIFFTVTDVVMVRFFFDRPISGEYAGVAIVGRIALFAAGLGGGILSASGRPGDPNIYSPAALWRALRTSGLIAGVVIVGFSIYDSELVSLIVGQRYAASAELLPSLGLLMLATILANDLFAYQITRNRGLVVLAALIGVVTTVVLSLYDHSNTAAIVRAYTAGALIAALVSCGALLRRAP
jgi:O-antigen/teichoic acid export membrane protein